MLFDPGSVPLTLCPHRSALDRNAGNSKKRGISDLGRGGGVYCNYVILNVINPLVVIYTNPSTRTVHETSALALGMPDTTPFDNRVASIPCQSSASLDRMVDDAFAPLLLSSSSSSGGGGESSKPLVKPGAAKKRLRNAVWEGQLVKQVKAVESELREKAESQEVSQRFFGSVRRLRKSS